MKMEGSSNQRKRDRVFKWNKRCLFCNKKFRMPTHIIDHIRWHINERPFSCKFCGASFIQRSSLKDHQKRYKDGQCKFIEEDPQIRRQKKLTCSICKKVFSTSGNRKRHQLTHSADDDKTTFTCEQCPATFCEPRYLNQHRQKYHESALPVKRLLTCDLCGDKFPRSLLGPHRLQFHPEDFYRSSRNRVERRQTTTKQKHHSKFFCIFCNEKSFKPSNVERHILTEIGERPFICTLCGTECVQKAGLKRHRDTFKGQCVNMKEEKEKMCQRHIKKLKAKLAKIMTHKLESQSRHQGQGHQKSGPSTPFCCSICDATFRNESELNEHKKNHFEATTDLHLDDHHNDLEHDDDGHENDKKKKKKRRKKIKFQCAFCPERFEAMERLEKHFMEVHKGNVALDDEDENLENEAILK